MTAISARTPSSLHPQPDSSLLKMEDRKRPLTDDVVAAHPSKKQATSANGAGKGHRDDDMPWKDDLEKVQKDALLRQLSEYKRMQSDSKSQTAELRKKARFHDDHIRAYDAWVKQLIDELILLLPKEDDSMELDAMPSSLQFADQKDFEQHLDNQATHIRALAERLAQRAKDFSPETSKLHAQITSLLAAEKEHVAELEKLRAETTDLDERLQNASLRYMLAEKKLDRARSVTAAKLDKGLLLGGTNSVKEESNAVKREDNQTNGVSDHGEELAELEIEVKKTTAIVERQQDQIAKLEEENSQLASKVTDLTTKSISLTDEDYSKTELYKQLKVQHDDAVKKLNELQAASNQLRDENSKMQAERSEFRAQLESESQAAISEKQTVLSQTQADLVRVRNHRDDLLADQSIKKASLDERVDSLKKLKELTSAQEDRIKTLEAENERLNTQAGNLMSVSSELDSMSSDQLKARVQEVEKKYAMVNSELTSISVAYTKSQKLATSKITDFVASEEKTAKLIAEKAKADQKYFAAMKSKDAREIEVRSLKVQTGKSSEVITSLKDAEQSSRTLIQGLEKQLSELKNALNAKTSEYQSASKTSASQGFEITKLNAQLTDLKNALSAKDSRLNSTATACRSAESEVEGLKASLAQTQKTLTAWKGKSGASEEHELLRQFAYCTVCRKELKDTVIKTCGHTFCHSCVDKVVQLRSRKCPNCGKPFGNNDHQRIIL